MAMHKISNHMSKNNRKSICNNNINANNSNDNNKNNQNNGRNNDIND